MVLCQIVPCPGSKTTRDPAGGVNYIMQNRHDPLKSQVFNLLIVGGAALLLVLWGRYLGSHSVPPEEIVRRYHVLMYANPAMWELTWLGIQTTQNPNDIWVIQEIIAEVKPDFIIETGTARGGSTAIWAMLQREVNVAGRVISIDVKDSVDRDKLPQDLLSRIDFLVGDSISPEVLARVRETVGGGTALAILDSDHRRSHVSSELQSYSPMIAIGSYIIVQDTNINGNPVFADAGPGPMEAVVEFLNSNRHFEADRTREKLMFTMHPKGYLKRTR